MTLPRLLDHPTQPLITERAPEDPAFNPRAPQMYARYGGSALANIELAMLAVGTRTVTSILDVPSGYGRVLRTLRAAFPDAELTACDRDEAAVAFCARTFGARGVLARSPSFEAVGGDPQYDLIWVGSLLAHLDRTRWAELLERLSGVLVAGGLLVFSCHGRWVADQVRGDQRWFGVQDELLRPALHAFDQTGFGHVEDPRRPGHGIALTSPAWVAGAVTATSRLRLVSLTERGWVGVQDVVSCQRGASGPLGQWFHGQDELRPGAAAASPIGVLRSERADQAAPGGTGGGRRKLEPAVVEGRDGWLFLQGDTNRIMEQSTGQLHLTAPELRSWVRLLENRDAWTSSRGIEYHLFIAPNKESVHPEHLPAGYLLSEDRLVNRLLDALGPDAPVDYPVALLRRLATEQQLYPKGDTHWNQVGAFHAYRRWVSMVSATTPLPAFELSDGTLTVSDAHVGDLGIKCVPQRTHRTHGLAPKQPKAVLVEDNGVHNAGHRQRWRNVELAGGPKLLVFHDSFFGAMARFWAESVGELVAVHTPLLEHQIIEEEAPDVVLSVMVERFLIHVPDDIFGRTSAEAARSKAEGAATSVQTEEGEDG